MTISAGEGRSKPGVGLRSRGNGIAGWLLAHYPLLTQRRFWQVQGLVLVVTSIHYAVEFVGVLEKPPYEYGFAFLPAALFLIPVVYAAVGFGSAGSLRTAIFCVILSVPELLLFHEGPLRMAVLLQLGIVGLIGVFAGQLVDREVSARLRAERATEAARASETKYRALFASSRSLILLVDAAGHIQEANPAAAVLAGNGATSVKGMALAGVLGAAAAERLLSGEEERSSLGIVFARSDGPPVYWKPTVTAISDGQGGPVFQIFLRDATRERQRRAGLRAYAAHVVQAQEEELKRIAHELHDEIVQRLILLCRQLDSVESGPPASGSDGLQEARQHVEEVVEEVREFAKALRPPALDDLGLATAVRRLVADLVQRTKIAGDFEVVGAQRRLPPDVEIAMFRIGQQALRNVERHARATDVKVRMTFASGEAKLDVVDNGVGFALPPDEDFAAAGHLGLLGMRERARSLGGSLKMRTLPSQGTEVSVSFPIIEAVAHKPLRRG